MAKIVVSLSIICVPIFIIVPSIQIVGSRHWDRVKALRIVAIFV